MAQIHELPKCDSMSIFIRNALIVTQDARRSVTKGNMLISGNTISYIGKKEFGADETIDAHGMAAMPGFINTHTHVAMSRFKGMLNDINLGGFLKKTFKYDAGRSENDLYDSSLVGIREMIDSGITSFVDLYYSEDIIAKAAEKLGMRAFLSWVTLDEQFTTQKGNPVKNAEHFIMTHKRSRLVSPSIGVQGIYVASDETLAKAKEISERHKTLMHMHLAETRKEVADEISKTGERPVEHLSKIGFLSSRLLAAHCVWLSDREIGLLASKRVNVSWNQISNSKLASGSARIGDMLKKGINVSLGTDSNGSNNSLNMFEAMKFSALSMKSLYGDASAITAQEVLDMITINAAKAIKREDIGSLEIGKLADIVLLRIDTPNMLPSNKSNIVNNIAYSANPSNVAYVLIDGKIVKEQASAKFQNA